MRIARISIFTARPLCRPRFGESDDRRAPCQCVRDRYLVNELPVLGRTVEATMLQSLFERAQALGCTAEVLNVNCGALLFRIAAQLCMPLRVRPQRCFSKYRSKMSEEKNLIPESLFE